VTNSSKAVERLYFLQSNFSKNFFSGDWIMQNGVRL